MLHDELDRLADEELMGLVARADAHAFEIVYDRHVAAAYSAAHGICGEDAADATRDAMLAVWRGAPRFRAHRSSVRAHVVATARRHAVQRMIRSGAGRAIAS